jgi:hydrogenase nickel incorporation protein HypB
VLLNKIDLLPYVHFDMQQATSYALTVNPRLRILPLSATRGEGLSAWYEWLHAQLISAAGEAPQP